MEKDKINQLVTKVSNMTAEHKTRQEVIIFLQTIRLPTHLIFIVMQSAGLIGD